MSTSRIGPDLSVEDIERLLVSSLAKAQRPGSVLACQHDGYGHERKRKPGGWWWLWGTEGGGIGFEDVDPRLVPYLEATAPEET